MQTKKLSIVLALLLAAYLLYYLLRGWNFDLDLYELQWLAIVIAIILIIFAAKHYIARVERKE